MAWTEGPSAPWLKIAKISIGIFTYLISNLGFDSSKNLNLALVILTQSFFIGAPGKAQPLGGESLLQARQGELLARRQGCPLRGGI